MECEPLDDLIVIPQWEHDPYPERHKGRFRPDKRPVYFRWMDYWANIHYWKPDDLPASSRASGTNAYPDSCFVTHNGVPDPLSPGCNMYTFVFCFLEDNDEHYLLGARTDATGAVGNINFIADWGNSVKEPQGKGMKAQYAAVFSHGPRASGPGSKWNYDPGVPQGDSLFGPGSKHGLDPDKSQVAINPMLINCTRNFLGDQTRKLIALQASSVQAPVAVSAPLALENSKSESSAPSDLSAPPGLPPPAAQAKSSAKACQPPATTAAAPVQGGQQHEPDWKKASTWWYARKGSDNSQSTSTWAAQQDCG